MSACAQLGGETIMLTGAEMQLGRGETIADTARVLSRYVDAIMIRTIDHDRLLELRRTRDRAGHQRPDRRTPSLPDHGRRHDLRGASRADRRQARSPGSATATTCCTPGSMPRPRFGFRPEDRDAAGAGTGRSSATSTGRASKGADGHDRRTIPRPPSTAPTASSPTPGSRWATRRQARGHNIY